MVIVAAFIGFVLVIIGQYYYIKNHYNKEKIKENLDIYMGFNEKEIAEGETGCMTIRITNKKAMPLPSILFKFSFGMGISLIDDENSVRSDNVYVKHIFTLLSYQRVTRKSRFKGKKRGYYEITDADIIVNDPMYINSEIVTVPLNIYVYVLPARSGYSGDLIEPFRQINGQILMNSVIYEDPFEFRGIREYQTYDTIKKINWTASAKTGELKVNQYFDTAKLSVIILLNLEKARCSGDEMLQEESIRITRTFLEWFSAKGISACVYTNGCDIKSGKEIVVDKGAGTLHISNALRMLARIDTKKEMKSFADIAGKCDNNKDAAVLMVSANDSKEVADTYNRLKGASGPVNWVIPCFKNSGKFETDKNVCTVEVNSLWN